MPFTPTLPSSYHASISEGQITSIQVVMNCGVRSVANLPRRSHVSMSTIRKNLGIPSVAEIRDKCLMLTAYKHRDKYLDQNDNLQGTITRAKSRGDILHPDQRGHLGKMSSTAMAIIWNKIPHEIRVEKNANKASRMIKSLYKKTP